MRIVRYFTIISLSILLIFAHKSFSQLEETDLELVKILGSTTEDPAENELILHWPISLDFDSENNLHVLDSGNQRVLKFDQNYNLELGTGREGQGPGEFKFRAGITNSGSLAIDNTGKIYVLDNINSRVQIFDSQMNFLTSFRVPWTVDGIDVDSNKRILLSTFGSKTEKLIFVFDVEGNYVTSFADKIVMNKNASGANQMNFSVNNHGEIFIAFNFWPIIRKYNSNYELVWEKEIDLKSLPARLKSVFRDMNKKNLSPNYFESHDFLNKDILGKFGPCILGVKTFNEKFYVLFNPNNFIEFDKDGMPLKLLRYPKLYASPWCFGVNNNNFYIVQESEVYIYRRAY